MAACAVCLREGVIFPLSGPSHIRNPPLNALALSPSRHNGGSFFNSMALPPPSTTSSGWSAATRYSRTRTKQLSTGATRGGIPFGRGALYYLLGNHFYIGEVEYKNEILPGERPDAQLRTIPWQKPPSKRSRRILLPHNASRSEVRPEQFERRARLVSAIARGRQWLADVFSGRGTKGPEVN